MDNKKKQNSEESKNNDKLASSGGGRKAPTEYQSDTEFKSKAAHKGAEMTNNRGTQNLGDSEDQGYEDAYLNDREDRAGSPKSGMGGT